MSSKPYPYPEDYGVPPLVPSPAVHNLSHLHVHTPKLDASLEYYTEILGMIETHRDERSVYLRAWGEWNHHSLVLTEGPEAGLECIAFRTKAPEHVEFFAERLRTAGIDVEEVPAGTEVAQGDAIRFIVPGGFRMELFYDYERIKAPDHPSRVYNRPSPFPGKGVGAHRLDHLNVQVPDPGYTRRWMETVLGFHTIETVVRPDNWEMVAGVAVSSLTHDINFFEGPGCLHHIAFHVEGVNDLHRAAEIYRENFMELESGPGRHGGTQGWFLYAKEPGGNRVELYTGSYQVFDPDWDVIASPIDSLPYMNVWVGQPMTMEFLTDGTALCTAQALELAAS